MTLNVLRWYFLYEYHPDQRETYSRGLSHFSITNCRSTFVFPSLDKCTRCSWNMLPSRVKDLRGGTAIDHNRGKRNGGKEKK